jgi:hypothetical protein
MNGRCCIFQPFDNGPHEKRYTDIIEPAVKAANLVPYRVDRDDGALVPVDALHEEIKNATACLADISTANPNVMYELGAAIATNKPVLIISSSGSQEFPFDIRHRAIIEYSRDSSSDFEKLKVEITKRLIAIVKTRAEVQEIVSASPVKSTHGLKPHEITALALIMANRDYGDGGVMPSAIRDDMGRAGYTYLATGLALTALQKQGFVISEMQHSSNFNEEPWTIYKLTSDGEEWLLENQERLDLRQQPKSSRSSVRNLAPGPITDDDVPF